MTLWAGDEATSRLGRLLRRKLLDCLLAVTEKITSATLEIVYVGVNEPMFRRPTWT